MNTQDNETPLPVVTRTLPAFPAKCCLADAGPYTTWGCGLGYTVLDSKGYNCMRLGRGHVFTLDLALAERTAAEWSAAHV